MRQLAATAAIALAALPGRVAAAEPSPTPLGGDLRRAGDAPGFVGDPLLAIVVVIGIALLAIVVTLAWVRLTGGRGGADRPAR